MCAVFKMHESFCSVLQNHRTSVLQMFLWAILSMRETCEESSVWNWTESCVFVLSLVSTRRTSEPRDTWNRQMSVNPERLSVVVVRAAVALTSLREFRTTQTEVLMDHREQSMDLCSEAGRRILLSSFINHTSASFNCFTSASTQISSQRSSETFSWQTFTSNPFTVNTSPHLTNGS